ncbi:unnamed protein product [Haemonchus placei]|uniref:Uncharacterized protein n=1 Tax=Haemonchus placei TaxID=6290 RepID=A0A0N4WUT1_HAEPC|nr:unnamed protein product [Haemonchus placei]
MKGCQEELLRPAPLLVETGDETNWIRKKVNKSEDKYQVTESYAREIPPTSPAVK